MTLRIWNARAVRALIGLLLLTSVTWAQPDLRFKDAPGLDEYPDAKALIIKDDIRFELQPDGSSVFVEHDAVKVLDMKGVEDYQTLTRLVELGQQRIEVVTAQTIAPDGSVSDQYKLTQTPMPGARGVYKNAQVFRIEFPDVKPGSVVEFHLRIHQVPRPGKAWWATTYVQNPDPILHSTFTAVVPTGEPFYYSTPGLGEVKPKRSASTEQDIYFWEVKDQPALLPEAGMPDTLSVLRRIEISSFKDWDALADWLHLAWDAGVEKSSAVQLKTAGLLPVVGDFDKRTRSLLSFIDSTFQVAGVLEDQFQPFPQDQLLEQERLSPIDLCALTFSMLKFAGYDGNLVYPLTGTKEGLASSLPTPDRLGQPLLRVRAVGHADVWFDSNNPGELAESPAGHQGQAGLLVSKEKPALFAFESTAPDQNRQELLVEARVDDTGRAEVGWKLEQFGLAGSALRSVARQLKEEKPAVRDRALARLFTNLSASISPQARVHSKFFNLKETDRSQGHDLSATVFIPAYVAKKNGTASIPLPIFVNGEMKSVLSSGRSRQYPVTFSHPFREEVRLKIIMPEQSKVVKAPPSIHVDTDVASFSSTSRVDGNVGYYFSRLVVKKPWVEPAELEELYEVATKMAASQEAGFEFIPGN